MLIGCGDLGLVSPSLLRVSEVSRAPPTENQFAAKWRSLGLKEGIYLHYDLSVFDSSFIRFGPNFRLE
jgi:hypothetical protein